VIRRSACCALALAASAAVAQPLPVDEAPAALSAPPPPPDRSTHSFNLLARIPRITVELVVGAASGLGVAYGGYQLGCALSDPTLSSCGPSGTYGAIGGFGLGVPIGVMLGGTLLDGDGAVLSTAFGTLLGMAGALGGLYYAQILFPDANPVPLIALPLVLAVVGYELSSHDSRTAAQAETRGKHLSWRILPTAAFTRSGATFGVSLLLP
jgi:hypothetical protein